MSGEGQRLGEKAHSVTVEFEQGCMWPSLRFTCHAPEGSVCRTVCSNSECEEGCYSVGDPGHDRVGVDNCNTVEWFENGDDVASDIFGGPTSITAPILVDWSRGEDGPEWRFAPSAPPTSEVRDVCDHRFSDGTLCKLTRTAHKDVPGLAALHAFPPGAPQ